MPILAGAFFFVRIHDYSSSLGIEYGMTFDRPDSSSGMQQMTIEGTVNKAFITLIILLGSAFSTWMLYFDGYSVGGMAVAGESSA